METRYFRFQTKLKFAAPYLPEWDVSLPQIIRDYFQDITVNFQCSDCRKAKPWPNSWIIDSTHALLWQSIERGRRTRLNGHSMVLSPLFGSDIKYVWPRGTMTVAMEAMTRAKSTSETVTNKNSHGLYFWMCTRSHCTMCTDKTERAEQHLVWAHYKGEMCIWMWPRAWLSIYSVARLCDEQWLLRGRIPLRAV